jgi:hypothetical protein
MTAIGHGVTARGCKGERDEQGRRGSSGEEASRRRCWRTRTPTVIRPSPYKPPVAGHLRGSGSVTWMAAIGHAAGSRPRGVTAVGAGAMRSSGDTAARARPGRSPRPGVLVGGSRGRLRAAWPRSAVWRPRALPSRLRRPAVPAAQFSLTTYALASGSAGSGLVRISSNRLRSRSCS